MTRFADQLLDDLMREHGPALAHAGPAAPPRRHITARRALLAASAGGLAAAAAVAGTLVAGSGTPAYAVTKNPDGTITLAVYQSSGIAGADARLRQIGDQQVVVVPVEAGCPSLRSLPGAQPPGEISVQEAVSGNGSVTVNARGIPAGDILVVGVETTPHGTLSGATLTSPPAPSCVSLPAPPA